MNNKGVLIVISGFSGSGKGTIIKQMLSTYDYKLSVSATTRNPRPGEQDGIDYCFKTREQFEQLINTNGLIEYAEYVGNYYGTPRAFVNDNLDNGHDVILEIEMQGAMQVKEQYPDALFIFITPPSASILQERLTSRNTEDEATIQKRLSRAASEIEYMKNYDYILVNDVLDNAVEQLHNIIENEHCRVSRNNAFINSMKNELLSFKKGDF